MHEADIVFVIMQHSHVLINIQVPQSKPMAAPMAASTPAAEIPKVVGAPFDLVLIEEAALPVAEPVPEPAVRPAVSVGVAVVAG
jgi:hypothetical protein